MFRGNNNSIGLEQREVCCVVTQENIIIIMMFVGGGGPASSLKTNGISVANSHWFTNMTSEQ
jgi:hypothetical protein